MEVRAEHLKDYLRARKMALLVTTYRERVVVTSENPEFDFGTKMVQDQKDDRWVGYISEIHEGGLPFGQKRLLFIFQETMSISRKIFQLLERKLMKTLIHHSKKKVLLGKDVIV